MVAAPLRVLAVYKNMMSARLAGDGLWLTWNARLVLRPSTFESAPRKMFAAAPVGLTTKLEKFSMPRSQPPAPMPVTLPALMHEGTARAAVGSARMPDTTTMSEINAGDRRCLMCRPPFRDEAWRRRETSCVPAGRARAPAGRARQDDQEGANASSRASGGTHRPHPTPEAGTAYRVI